MPHLRGVTVHITDSHGEPLQESGVQYLRHHTGGSKVSAYVQSTTDVAFQISLQPDIPFIEHSPPSDTPKDEDCAREKKNTRLAAGPEDRSVEQSHEKFSNDARSSLVRLSTTPKSHSAPAFAFLAVLYLDGRRIPERKISKAIFIILSSWICLMACETCCKSRPNCHPLTPNTWPVVQVPIYISEY